MRFDRCVAVMLLTLPAFGRDRVWDIEFFGYKGVDVAAVRQALPAHEGDVYAHDDTKNKVRHAVSDALGRAPTDVQGVCCNGNGDFVLFIGLPGSSSKNFSYNAAPEGEARLSEEITVLQGRVEQAWKAAVRKGGDGAREDDSNGYALSQDPALRALQLKVRDYALAHGNELLHVLESSADPRQRQTAANTLGYARKSTRQIQALVQAARDPDDGVRNDAVRALGVLASADKEMTKSGRRK
ncbi:MAG TPA: HEAT repeat domain-containing protein [Bryobacteraceae bacterium]|nr:HEAT repeat domain-containing protein [Bryobacteraceae bacterium]